MCPPSVVPDSLPRGADNSSENSHSSENLTVSGDDERFLDHNSSSFDDTGPISTLTLDIQTKTEKMIVNMLNFHTLAIQFHGKGAGYRLERELHAQYLLAGLTKTKTSQIFFSNRTWILYWILHSLELLQVPIPDDIKSNIIEWMRLIQSPDGGFGGGPNQLSHLATTYAMMLAMSLLGPDAYQFILRRPLYNWMLSLKNEDGSFAMHFDGEVDVRACYCSLVIASLTNTLTTELTQHVDDFVASCQNYDGGIGALPGRESHGGYSYCGMSALSILKKTKRLELGRLLHWAAMKQMAVEGGFQGRTNKLVDSCYSWWVSALFPLLDKYYLNQDKYPSLDDDTDLDLDEASIHSDIGEIEDKNEKKKFKEIEKKNSIVGTFEKLDQSLNPIHSAPMFWDSAPDHMDGSWLFDQLSLQKYLLICCQDDQFGGMKDKPKVMSDYYHTCYALSGLSISQHAAPYSPQQTVLMDDNIDNKTLNGLFQLIGSSTHLQLQLQHQTQQ